VTRKKGSLATTPNARNGRAGKSGMRSTRATRAEASRKEAQSELKRQSALPSSRFESRIRPHPPHALTTREARAAELRLAYERGELCSTETTEQLSARNAAYVALHRSPSPARIIRQVGVPLLPVTEAIHRKHFIQKKPWKQCFSEFYTEREWKPVKSKVSEFERGVRKNVKAKEARLQKKKTGSAIELRT
jgi:hypothetical protein